MARAKAANLCADFETTTDPNDCRVWAWGIAYIDYPDTVEVGHDIEEFVDRICDENSRIYFHNLRFDGRFLLDYLLRSGYMHTDGKLIDGTFTTLISMMGMYYSIKVQWMTGQRTEFRDSLKKLPMTVAEVAEAFNLEMKKGEIDYHKPRPVGYRMDAEEREYLHNDVSIMAHAMNEVLGEGMTRLTVGSDALNEYKKLMNRDFDKWFPVLDNDVDADIRAAYRGGFTYVSPRYRGRRIKKRGKVYDVNSLYPYIMRERLMPYGEPKFVDGLPDTDRMYPLSIFTVTFTAKLKTNHIPCIQIKNNSRFHTSDYLELIDEPITLAVSNVDWALYNDHYDIEVIEYGTGYLFKADKGMFNTYVDKWSEIKAKSVGGRRVVSKLFMNSLYGKFATNPDITPKVPVMEDDIVKLKLGDAETRDPVYTAAGVFITAWARDLTIRAAQSNYDTFAYCDTDSLHLITDTEPDNLDIHPYKLGAWKHEYDFSEAIFIRAKAYAERIYKGKKHGKIETHIAGVPKRIADKLTFRDLYDGKRIKGKLVPKAVPGGVVLAEVPYVLKFT